jgi:hypothetical protein
MITEFDFYEKQLPLLLARFVDANDEPIQQADVASIAVSFRSYETPTTEHATEVPLAANVIFDTLQTDDAWKEDATGYNFKYQPSSGKLDQANSYSYLIEVVITLTSGDVIPALWRADQLAVQSLS